MIADWAAGPQMQVVVTFWYANPASPVTRMVSPVALVVVTSTFSRSGALLSAVIDPDADVAVKLSARTEMAGGRAGVAGYAPHPPPENVAPTC